MSASGLTMIGAKLLAELGIEPTNKWLLRNVAPCHLACFGAAIVKLRNLPQHLLSREGVEGVMTVLNYLYKADAFDMAGRLLFSLPIFPNEELLIELLEAWDLNQRMYENCVRLVDRLEGDLEARCHLGLGKALRNLEEHAECRKHLNAALELFESFGDIERTAWSYHELGLLEADLGNDSTARPHYEEALRRFRLTNCAAGVAAACNDLARVQNNQGDYPAARRQYEESLSHAGKLSDRQLDRARLAWSSYNFGHFMSDQREFACALKYIHESADVFRRLDNQLGLALCMYTASIILLNRNHLKFACALGEQARRSFQKSLNLGGAAWASHILGRIAFKLGNWGLMRERYRYMLKIHYGFGDQRGIAFALEGLGRHAVGCGDLEHGAMLFGAAANLRERYSCPLPPADIGEYQDNIAHLHTCLGDQLFNVAWVRGYQLPQEQVIVEANALDERWEGVFPPG